MPASASTSPVARAAPPRSRRAARRAPRPPRAGARGRSSSARRCPRCGSTLGEHAVAGEQLAAGRAGELGVELALEAGEADRRVERHAAPAQLGGALGRRRADAPGDLGAQRRRAPRSAPRPAASTRAVAGLRASRAAGTRVLRLSFSPARSPGKTRCGCHATPARLVVLADRERRAARCDGRRRRGCGRQSARGRRRPRARRARRRARPARPSRSSAARAVGAAKRVERHVALRGGRRAARASPRSRRAPRPSRSARRDAARSAGSCRAAADERQPARDARAARGVAAPAAAAERGRRRPGAAAGLRPSAVERRADLGAVRAPASNAARVRSDSRDRHRLGHRRPGRCCSRCSAGRRGSSPVRSRSSVSRWAPGSARASAPLVLAGRRESPWRRRSACSARSSSAACSRPASRASGARCARVLRRRPASRRSTALLGAVLTAASGCVAWVPARSRCRPAARHPRATSSARRSCSSSTRCCRRRARCSTRCARSTRSRDRRARGATSAPPRAAIARDPDVAAAARSVVQDPRHGVRARRRGLGLGRRRRARGHQRPRGRRAGRHARAARRRASRGSTPTRVQFDAAQRHRRPARRRARRAGAGARATSPTPGTSGGDPRLPANGPYDVRAGAARPDPRGVTQDAYGRGPVRRLDRVAARARALRQLRRADGRRRRPRRRDGLRRDDAAARAAATACRTPSCAARSTGARRRRCRPVPAAADASRYPARDAMGKTLVIAEKPSVGRDLVARAAGRVRQARGLPGVGRRTS